MFGNRFCLLNLQNATMGKPRIRIKDIAECAGVSVGTVDRVLHERGNVSPEAQAKVQRALQELEYQPNIIASTLASNKVLHISSLIPDPEADPYWQLPLLGIQKAMEGVTHYGIAHQTIHFDLFSASDFKQKAIELLEDELPDALLVSPIYLQEGLWLLEQCRDAGLPVIFINTDIHESEVLSYVGQDSYQSGVLAGRLLELVIGEPKGTALLLNLGKETSNARHLADKEKGFRYHFRTTTMHVLSLEFAAFNQPNALRRFVSSLVQEYPDLRGLFISNSRSYQLLDCAEQLLRAVHIIGFDLLPRNLHYLRGGQIDFLINQNPVQQGYVGLMTAVNRLLFKKEIQRCQYLPLDIIVPENVQYYLDREKEFQIVV